MCEVKHLQTGDVKKVAMSSLVLQVNLAEVQIQLQGKRGARSISAALVR